MARSGLQTQGVGSGSEFEADSWVTVSELLGYSPVVVTSRFLSVISLFNHVMPCVTLCNPGTRNGSMNQTEE